VAPEDWPREAQVIWGKVYYEMRGSQPSEAHCTREQNSHNIRTADDAAEKAGKEWIESHAM
jgi:hypothetical protein